MWPDFVTKASHEIHLHSNGHFCLVPKFLVNSTADLNWKIHHSCHRVADSTTSSFLDSVGNLGFYTAIGDNDWLIDADWLIEIDSLVGCSPEKLSNQNPSWILKNLLRMCFLQIIWHHVSFKHYRSYRWQERNLLCG